MQKMVIAAVLFCIGCSGCASCPFQDWSRADTARQVALSGLITVDWAQTREIATNPNYYETNWMLGEYPTRTEVDLFMIASLCFHLIVPAMLKPKYRAAWQYTWMAERAYWVHSNYRFVVRF